MLIIQKTFVDVSGDLIAGILLSKIVSLFANKNTTTIKGELAVARLRKSWWDEIRISPKQYDRAIKLLQELGIVRVVNHMQEGKKIKIPHIFLNTEKLEKHVREAIEQIREETG